MSSATRSTKKTSAGSPIDRPGSLLTHLLPGLISLAVIFAAPLMAGAQEGAAAGAASAAGAADMKSRIEQQVAQIPTGEAGVTQIMDGLNERLQLSDEQQAEIRPIIEQTVARMEQSRDKFIAGEIPPMALGMQLQMAGQQAAKKVEPLLNEKQRVEYEALRKEQRQEMMKAMQRGR